MYIKITNWHWGSHPIDGAMGSTGEGWFRKLSVVFIHNNAIVAKGILVTILHCGTPKPRLSAIYIVSSVGTSFSDLVEDHS